VHARDHSVAVVARIFFIIRFEGDPRLAGHWDAVRSSGRRGQSISVFACVETISKSVSLVRRHGSNASR